MDGWRWVAVGARIWTSDENERLKFWARFARTFSPNKWVKWCTQVAREESEREEKAHFPLLLTAIQQPTNSESISTQNASVAGKESTESRSFPPLLCKVSPFSPSLSFSSGSSGPCRNTSAHEELLSTFSFPTTPPAAPTYRCCQTPTPTPSFSSFLISSQLCPNQSRFNVYATCLHFFHRLPAHFTPKQYNAFQFSLLQFLRRAEVSWESDGIRKVEQYFSGTKSGTNKEREGAREGGREGEKVEVLVLMVVGNRSLMSHNWWGRIKWCGICYSGHEILSLLNAYQRAPRPPSSNMSIVFWQILHALFSPSTYSFPHPAVTCFPSLRWLLAPLFPLFPLGEQIL